MTNEEIRVDLQNKGKLSFGAYYTVSDIDQFMSEARKDERDTLISEIHNYIFEYDMELHVMNDILTKLNELRAK